MRPSTQTSILQATLIVHAGTVPTFVARPVAWHDVLPGFHPSHFKLNPSKLEKNEDVNLNLAHLLNILSELVEKIFMAAEILPP